MQLESIEFSFLSIFTLLTFFIFLMISKYSYKIKNGALGGACRWANMFHRQLS